MRGPKPRPLGDRFWEKVLVIDDEDSCWEWQASLNSQGYGQLFYNQRPIGAHRLSYFLTFGKYSSELEVCHRCDNPRCVRPSHLFLGTHKDNMRDCNQKGHHSPHILTSTQLQVISESTLSERKLAKQLGVSKSTIGRSRRRLQCQQ